MGTSPVDTGDKTSAGTDGLCGGGLVIWLISAWVCRVKDDDVVGLDNAEACEDKCGGTGVNGRAIGSGVGAKEGAMVVGACDGEGCALRGVADGADGGGGAKEWAGACC